MAAYQHKRVHGIIYTIRPLATASAFFVPQLKGYTLEIMTTQRPNGVAVVQPTGRIDRYTALAFKKRLGELIDSGYRWLVIDFSAVTFLDSTGLGALITGLKRAQELGGDLRLAQVPHNVRMMIELTALQYYLPRYASVDDALASYP